MNLRRGMGQTGVTRRIGSIAGVILFLLNIGSMRTVVMADLYP